MPWSDWQDPLDMPVAPTSLRVGADSASHDPGEHGFVQPSISNLSLTAASRHDDLGYTIGRFDLLQFTASTSWESRRDWFPAPLQSLVEGVDYAARPDRNPLSDDDAYVEYEDGLNEHLTWTMPTVSIITPLAVNRTTGDLGPSEGTGVGTLERISGSAYPAVAGTDIGVMPVGATIFTEGLGQTGSFTPAAPSSLSFAYVIAVGSVDIPVDTVIGWGVQLAGVPTQVVRSPRWRYWIPGSAEPIPLRQRQRDDGLGLSTARQRARNSRQRSIRQRAYL